MNSRIPLLLAALLGLVSSASAQIIANGSFESPVVSASPGYQTFTTTGAPLPGWVVGTNDVDIVLQGFSGWLAKDGTQLLDLNGYYAGSIYQVFATTPGTAYTLSFWYANNTGGAGGEVAQVEISDVLSNASLLNNSVTHTDSTNSNLNWLQFTQSFVAPSTGARLQFTSRSNWNDASGGILLDDVRIIPEPEFYAFAMVGFVAVIVGIRRFRQRLAAPAV